jgi:ribosomal 30S subunit maturation factor RimM
MLKFSMQANRRSGAVVAIHVAFESRHTHVQQSQRGALIPFVRKLLQSISIATQHIDACVHVVMHATRYRVPELY